MAFKSDIEIAREANKQPIQKIGDRLGIPAEHLLPFGHDKAKVGQEFIDSLAGRPDGKLILVTAINPTPAGEGNDAAISEGAHWAGQVLCAWGTHGAHLGRGATVEALLRATGRPLFHLGLSKAGHPRHPLYIGYDRQLEPWPGRATPGGGDGLAKNAPNKSQM